MRAFIGLSGLSLYMYFPSGLPRKYFLCPISKATWYPSSLGRLVTMRLYIFPSAESTMMSDVPGTMSLIFSRNSLPSFSLLSLYAFSFVVSASTVIVISLAPSSAMWSSFSPSCFRLSVSAEKISSPSFFIS